MSELILSRLLAQQLRQIVDKREWSGTITELAGMFSQSTFGDARTPARLGSWLRRNEPTLWWDYGVLVRFSRTGEERSVRLSRRTESVARAFT